VLLQVLFKIRVFKLISILVSASFLVITSVSMQYQSVESIQFQLPLFLQCFDTVGWAAGRASGLQKTEWWGVGMVICLERCADLHMAQLMPLPLTVSCFSKLQISFTFLVPAHPGSPGQRAVKRVCVCVCVCYSYRCKWRKVIKEVRWV